MLQGRRMHLLVQMHVWLYLSDKTAPLERLFISCICCACSIWQERDSCKEPSCQIGIIAWQWSLTRSVNLRKMSHGAIYWPFFSMKLFLWNRKLFFFKGTKCQYFESSLWCTLSGQISIISLIFVMHYLHYIFSFFHRGTDYLYIL